ncbi:MAG: hypothetical protein MZV70_76355 [Desulfobacterales bacterium]|nr:hypothetical protein [Desulfobacterales bacterium]
MPALVKAAGAQVLREAERLNPEPALYDFQGLEETGLQYLAQARQETGLLIVTEVMESQDVDLVNQYAIIQIGARNMQPSFLNLSEKLKNLFY